jgi:glycosyltransferase involved in cell wall biosynthesis
MKRVIMIGPSPSAKGGIATVIGTLLRNGYAEHGDCEFVATHVSGSTARKALTALRALLRVSWLLASGQAGLLHAHVASDASFWRKALFIRLAQLSGCPVIFHLHSGEFRLFLEQRMSARQRRFAQALMRRATCALVLSDDATALLRGVGVERVELLPNPIQIGASLPRTPTAEILFLGRLDTKKGVYDLLRAFATVRARVPAARLVLAGEGELGQVRALAVALGLQDAVELPGWVGEEQRSALLARAGAFVLPSHFEQMPMVVLEAMVAGCPVVATRVGGVPCMLAGGECGHVVDVGDEAALAAAMIAVLSDAAEAAAMAARARARVGAEYAVEVVLARLRARYAELKR